MSAARSAYAILDGEVIAAGKPTWARISDGDCNAIVDIDAARKANRLTCRLGPFSSVRGFLSTQLVLRMPVG
jgi:hypothetical protein